MESARKIPVNRIGCFSGHNCPPETPDKQKENKVKELLLTARQRSDANKTLRHLKDRFQCSLFGLLEAVARQVDRGVLSAYVLDVLLERIEGQKVRNELTWDQITELEEFKASRKKLEA
jgi:hypothetical protein